MVLAAGGAVIEILAEGNTGAPATRTELDAWVNTFHLHVTTVRDPDGVTSAMRTTTVFGVRESTFIVDLGTMHIVRKINGSTAGVGPSGPAQAIPMLMTLLGH